MIKLVNNSIARYNAIPAVVCNNSQSSLWCVADHRLLASVCQRAMLHISYNITTRDFPDMYACPQPSTSEGLQLHTQCSRNHLSILCRLLYMLIDSNLQNADDKLILSNRTFTTQVL